MEITEPGYYWYKSNHNEKKFVVQVTKGYGGDCLSVWFFGSEIDMVLPVALKRGEFLRKVEDYE